MAPRSKHPFLTIQESAKVWISDDSFSAGESNEAKTAGKDSIAQRQVLPLAEGQLDNPLAFPLYMIRDSSGKDRPADKTVWDAMLIRRLLSGGDYYYHLQDSNPTELYCNDLLEFHYSELSSIKKYEFLPYLRYLLKGERTRAKERLN